MEKSPILIANGQFYGDIAGLLLEGAQRALEEAGIKDGIEVIAAPGAFELPAIIAMAAKTGLYHGFIALGCVIRGQTSHYDLVCSEVARGLQSLAMQHRIALGFGVLTCETHAQALERADPDRLDRGGDAARACLSMIGTGALLRGRQP